MNMAQELITPALSALVFLVCMAIPAPVLAEPAATTVFLVRHAEKADTGEDPELSPAGAERSLALADALRDAGIQRIYSTDYIRTRDTAAPLAELTGLNVELYDPDKLEQFAGWLRRHRQVQLVVGHSNTTPELVTFLGGAAGDEIDEETEHDRLYILTIGPDGTVTSLLIRYGASARP